MLFSSRRDTQWHEFGLQVSLVTVMVAGLLLMVEVCLPSIVYASHSFSRHVIEQGINGDGAESIHPVDFDGDGDTDMVTAAFVADEFAWYERSDTDLTVFTRHVIESGANADGAREIAPVDMDGDGDVDVATADALDTYAWYERNDADSTVFTRHVIESGAPASNAREIEPVDMDGDDDTDVVTAAGLADEFAWYERDDADSTVFTRHVIESRPNADGAEDIVPVDMDGDGDVDVVTAADFSDEFAWYESPISGGGEGGSSGGGGGGGGGCLIERSSLPTAPLRALRDLRDAALDSAAGRHLTTLYYEGFGGSEVSNPRP